MSDKQYLKRPLISKDSVAGTATLVLLVLFSVSAQPNQTVYSSKLCFFLQHWFGNTASEACDFHPRDRRQLIWGSPAADLWPSPSLHKFSTQQPDGIRNWQLQCCKLLFSSKSGKILLHFL